MVERELVTFIDKPALIEPYINRLKHDEKNIDNVVENAIAFVIKNDRDNIYKIPLFLKQIGKFTKLNLDILVSLATIFDYVSVPMLQKIDKMIKNLPVDNFYLGNEYVISLYLSQLEFVQKETWNKELTESMIQILHKITSLCYEPYKHNSFMSFIMTTYDKVSYNNLKILQEARKITKRCLFPCKEYKFVTPVIDYIKTETQIVNEIEKQTEKDIKKKELIDVLNMETLSDDDYVNKLSNLCDDIPELYKFINIMFKEVCSNTLKFVPYQHRINIFLMMIENFDFELNVEVFVPQGVVPLDINFELYNSMLDVGLPKLYIDDEQIIVELVNRLKYYIGSEKYRDVLSIVEKICSKSCNKVKYLKKIHGNDKNGANEFEKIIKNLAETILDNNNNIHIKTARIFIETMVNLKDIESENNKSQTDNTHIIDISDINVDVNSINIETFDKIIYMFAYNGLYCGQLLSIK